MESIPVFFDNSEGDRLQGIKHLPKGKPPFPTIIIFHGLTGVKSEVYRYLTKLSWLLCSKGFLVIRFDFRGHGESSRKLEEITLDMLVKDACDILNWTKKQPDVDKARIGIVSRSLSPALYLKLTKKEIKASVLHCPAINLKDTIERGWGFGFKLKNDVIYGSQVLTNKFYNNLGKYNLLKTIPEIDVPQLIIAGSADDMIDPTLVIKLYRLARSIKKVKFINGADHDFASKEYAEEVNQLTLAWLEKYVK